MILLPDFGLTMGGNSDLLKHVRVVGVSLRTITEYPKHCEISAVLYQGAYPLGRLITLATPQTIAEIFQVISRYIADDALRYEMDAAIGPRITGIGGETHRPLLGLFGHVEEPPGKPSWEMISATWEHVTRTTVADIKTFYRQPSSGPPQNWERMIDLPNWASPGPPPALRRPPADTSYPSRQARRLAERLQKKGRQ